MAGHATLLHRWPVRIIGASHYVPMKLVSVVFLLSVLSVGIVHSSAFRNGLKGTLSNDRGRQLDGLVTSGKCNVLILTKIACITQATKLGIDYEEWGIVADTLEKPPGCYLSGHSNKLSVNTNQNSDVNCGTDSRDCICGTETTTAASTTGVPTATSSGIVTTTHAPSPSTEPFTTAAGANGETTSALISATTTTRSSAAPHAVTTTTAAASTVAPTVKPTVGPTVAPTTTPSAKLPLTTTSVVPRAETSTAAVMPTTTRSQSVLDTTTMNAAPITTIPASASVQTTKSSPHEAPTTTKWIAPVTTVPPPLPSGDVCVWRGADCDGERNSALDLECDQDILSSMAGYCDCKGDGSVREAVSLCRYSRAPFTCEDECMPDLPTYEPPMSGRECGDHCDAHGTGTCKIGSSNGIAWSGQCECSSPWSGLDCTRKNVRYGSTIFLRATIPVLLDDEEDSAAVKRALAREFLDDAASVLNVDRERFEELLPSTEDPEKGVILDFIIHEDLNYGGLDQASAVQSLAEAATRGAGVPSSVNLFTKSQRKLLSVVSPPQITIEPMELKLKINRQLPKETLLDGLVTLKNSAANADDLVVTKVSYVGDERWVKVKGWKKGGYTILSSQTQSVSFQADARHFDNFGPGSYSLALEFEHNVPAGPHAIEVTLNVIDTDHASKTADSIPEDLETLQDSPRFLAGLATGAVLIVLFLCLFLCCLRLCQRCCGGRKLKLERGGNGKFQQIQNASTESNGDLELVEGSMNPMTGRSITNSFGLSVSGNKNQLQRPGRLDSGGSTSVSVASVPPRAAVKPQLKFISDPALEPEEYERKWQSMDTTKLWGTTLSRLPGDGELEKLLSQDNIQCMASGGSNGVQKFYFYAENHISGSEHLFMVECSVTVATRHIAFVFKTGSEGLTDAQSYNVAFIEMVSARIKPLVQ